MSQKRVFVVRVVLHSALLKEDGWLLDRTFLNLWRQVGKLCYKVVTELLSCFFSFDMRGRVNFSIGKAIIPTTLECSTRRDGGCYLHTCPPGSTLFLSGSTTRVCLRQLSRLKTLGDHECGELWWKRVYAFAKSTQLHPVYQGASQR